MNIGDLFLQLLADGSKLTASVTKEAQKAGDAGAKTLGQSMSAGLRTAGVKAFGLAASGAFAIATKGALELENAQAEIAAQTGLNAEQSKQVALDANRIAGEQRSSLEAVRDIAIHVHNDLGLAGDAAAKMTSKIAEFARVTHQDGVGAVTALDDITDAYSLSAADQATVLDKLLVSQQRYGGSITENEAALSKLAPQLNALNATYDDGIALLNLFAASGIDASKAQAALNTAVKKLAPGEGLDDLVKRISSIEDPTLRAQEAIKTFGAKGGVPLANALKPGVTSLDQFGISAQDAAGATDKAADVIDSTFTGRIQKAISVASAKLREFGAAVGPALTGLATIGTFAATAFPGIGQKIGEKLAGGIGQALAKSKLIGAGLATALEALPGVSSVKGAIVSAGTKIGTALGISAAAGFALAAGAAVAAVAFVAQQQQAGIDKMGEDLKGKAAEFAKIASDQSLAKAIAGTKEQLDRLPGNAYDSKNKVIAVINTLQAEQNRRAAEAGASTTESYAGGVEDSAPAVNMALTSSIVDPTLKAAYSAQALAEAGGARTPESFAAGVRKRRMVVQDSFNQLLDDMKNLLGRGETIARDIGILTSKQLAKGLHDRRAAVRAEAQAVQAQAEQELALLISRGGKVGKKAGEELKKGLNSKNPDIRASAQRVKDIVDNKFHEIPPKANDAGSKTGQAFLNGLKPKLDAALTTVATFVRNAFNIIGSPAPSGGGGGKHAHKAAGGGFRAGQPFWANERTGRSELIVPSTGGYVLTHAEAVSALGGGGAAGPSTTIVNMPVSGALPVRTITDISGEMQRIDDSGVLPSQLIAPRYRRREAAGAGSRV